MTYEQKINMAKARGINISDVLLENRNIVGIYKFFYYNDNEEICFYIGKSTDIIGRLFGSSDGHIYMYLKNNLSKLVPCKIDEYIKKGYKISVKIQEIEYHDTSFSRASHRLALAELQEIVSYQEKGQCLFQFPDGVGKNEQKFWADNYRKQ